jgi:hypothetical protein
MPQSNHHGNQGFKQISVLDLCDAIELLRIRRGRFPGDTLTSKVTA